MGLGRRSGQSKPPLARNVGREGKDPVIVDLGKIRFARHLRPGDGTIHILYRKAGFAKEIWQISRETLRATVRPVLLP
jgi:hypothetical protein